MEENRDDHVLLERFAEAGEEEAFRSLVDRYLDLVYSTARRHCANHHMAEEVSQRVFSILAQKAAALCSHPTLGGWLFRTTFYEATKAMRAESTRRDKTQQWQELNELPEMEGVAIPPETVAALDEAIASLPDDDRELVVMRYFREASFQQIGDRLGISENAGQKRAVRVLEKLSRLLGKKGVTLGAVALGSVLTATIGKAAIAAPAGLAVSVTTQSLAPSAGSGAVSIAVQPFVLAHAKLIGLVALGALLVPLGFHFSSAAGNQAAPREAAERTGGKLSALATKQQPTLASDPLFAGTVDPAERMRRILALEDRYQRQMEIGYLVRELPVGDLPAALKILADRDPEDTAHLGAFVEGWVTRDPRAAIAFVESRSEAYQKNYWDGLLKGWVRTAPEEALAYVTSLPAGANGEARLEVWVEQLSYLDGGRVLSLLSTSPDRCRPDHFKQVFLNWPTDQLDGALDSIDALEGPKMARSAIGALLRSPMSKNGAELLEKVTARFGEELVGEFAANFYGAWYSQDTAAALESVRAIEDPVERERAVQKLLRGGGKGEYAARLEFTADFSEGRSRHAGSNYIMISWLMEDSSGALAHIAALKPGEQASFAKVAGEYFGQVAPREALQWSEDTLVNTEAKGTFLKHLLRESIKRDFDAALELMEEIPDSPAIREVAVDIADAYAARSPEEAMEWAVENTPPDQLQDATGRVMRRWLRADPEAASGWIAELEAGSVRDVALDESARAHRNSGDRAEAMQLAFEVSEPEKRRRAINSLAGHWTENDGRAFREWLLAQPSEVRGTVLAGENSWEWLLGLEGVDE